MRRILCIAMALLCALGVLGSLASCDNGNADKNDEADIFEIKYNGETLELGAKADSALSKLGAPVSKQNTGNCGGLGETTRYDYSAYYYTNASADEIVLTLIEKADCKKGYSKLLKIKAAAAEATYVDVRSGKTYSGEELRRGLALELTGEKDSAQLYYFKRV